MMMYNYDSKYFNPRNNLIHHFKRLNDFTFRGFNIKGYQNIF